MDRSDDTTRGYSVLYTIRDMYRYEGNNSTYPKISRRGTRGNRGELSTQSIQGIPDSRADILNNT